MESNIVNELLSMNRKWLVLSTMIFFGALFWFLYKSESSKIESKNRQSAFLPLTESLWNAPDSNQIATNESGDLIRYGKKLIRATAAYFGPAGSISHNANGMNCQNCHLDAGTRAWAGNFGGVAAVYPRFSERRGSAETINQRISDCFERSMNGIAPDSNSLEMRAMHAYIIWLGKDVLKGKRPPGSGLEILSFMKRAANPQKGGILYQSKCQPCHGANGEGQPDSAYGYKYPPVWGAHSYNTAAGLYRLSKFAGFIKDNMPFGSDYKNEQLNTEEAWDIAAYVNSQLRPVKKFVRDWPNIMLKPADLPDGPFPDSYPALQHKYGPYAPIAKYKKDFGMVTQK
jgi:thiosulfate dehydrogenase